MPHFIWSRAVEGAQDRAAVFPRAGGLVAVVADGAGGRNEGEGAADAVIDAVENAADLFNAGRCCELITRLDVESAAGESTAVLAVLFEDRILGASIGDSAAWLIDRSGYQDLTRRQNRKPLLGTGSAAPVPFAHAFGEATLLLGSDGLFKYSPPERICEIALEEDLHSASRRLIDLVRLKSGRLADDVAVVLCRSVNR